MKLIFDDIVCCSRNWRFEIDEGQLQSGSTSRRVICPAKATCWIRFIIHHDLARLLCHLRNLSLSVFVFARDDADEITTGRLPRRRHDQWYGAVVCVVQCWGLGL